MSSFGERINQLKAKHDTASVSTHSGSGAGSRLSGGSGTTVVPSFRFNKADDLMVEVTPTSSFEELEEPVTLVNIGSVQDTSSTLNYSTTEHTDPFLRTLIPSGPQSVIKYDDIDEYYGTDHVAMMDEDYYSTGGEEDKFSTSQFQPEPRSLPPSISGLNVSVGKVESSPIKEAILNKFARLAPSTSHNSMPGISRSSSNIPNLHPTQSEDSLIRESEMNENDSVSLNRTTSIPGQPQSSSSWLGQVKGKIAKTVQEKYSEYKHENELRKQAAAAIAIPNTSDHNKTDNHIQDHENNDTNGGDDTNSWPKGISHSLSMDGNFSEPCSLSSVSAEKLMSEILASDVMKNSKSIENLKRSDPTFDTTKSFNQSPNEIEQLQQEKKKDLDLQTFLLDQNDSPTSSENITPVPISPTEDYDTFTPDNESKSKNIESSQNKNMSPLQTPERARRRYLGISSLYSSFRASKTNSPLQPSQQSDIGEELLANAIDDDVNADNRATSLESNMAGSLTTSTYTPSKGSLRNRMFNLMGKSPSSSAGTISSQPASIPTSGNNIDSLASISMKELSQRSPMDDPFSGYDSNLQLYEKASPDHDFSPPRDSEDEVEHGIEIGEEFVFVQDPDNKSGENDDGSENSVDAEVIVQAPDNYSFWPLENIQFWWMAALPLCVLLILQILPLPSWIIGFVTGILIAVPTSAYVTYLLFGQRLEPMTPFIENVRKKVAKRPAIIVQEELERKFVWMNLWPTKKGPYDPLSYDVRRTSSVRLMLHGPWIEMRFPKRNLPLRRMHDDVEPKKVDFYDQVEVIDLSNCSIDLLPENLPSKRNWSKKYPIRIRTNMRKQTVSNSETSKKMKAKVHNHPSKDSDDDQEISKSSDSNDKEMNINVESPTPEEILQQSEMRTAIQKSLETHAPSKYGEANLENQQSRRALLDDLNNVSERSEILEDEDFFIDAFDNEWTSTTNCISDKYSSAIPDLGENTLNKRPNSLPVQSTGTDNRNNCDILNQESDLSSEKDNTTLTTTNPDQPISKSSSDVMDSQTDGPYTKEENPNKTFYLFTRTGREKEEWYNRFMVAANFMEDWEHQNPKSGEKADPNYETQKVREQKFRMFMEDYFQAKDSDCATQKQKETKETPEMIQCAKEQVAFLNVYLARMWHDLHDSTAFLDFLREKISRKLLKVKIAHYFNEVRVTQLDLGPKLPQILSASLPWQDELGLWVNLDIEYNGICQATIETQGIRLPGKDEPDREAQELLRLFARQAATMDSDEEDSAEEDDDPIPQDRNDTNDGGENDIACDKLQPHAGFKARMLDKVLKSDFVAKVADSEWVKKNITSRNITLQLQVHIVKGTLTLNFPPAPSDRIWYGFRSPPQLEMALKPCFGGRSLGKYESTLSAVMRQIIGRLKEELFKVLVYPNLDDLDVPFMDHISYSMWGTANNSPITPGGADTLISSVNIRNEDKPAQNSSNEDDTKYNATKQ